MAEAVCPNGLTFKTISRMCEYYEVKQGTYVTRLKNGWTERQALGIALPPRGITCPNGVAFRSEKQMCDYYGVYINTFRDNTLKYGWTAAQALGIVPRPCSVVCPNGLNFDSVSRMCAHYDVGQSKFKSRLGSGWTERQALGIDKPPLPKTIPVTCPRGTVFRTLASMCRHYSVGYPKFKTRITLGWTESQALGIDPPPNSIADKNGIPTEIISANSRLQVLERVKELLGVQFFLVQDSETLQNYVLNEKQIKTYPSSIKKFTKLK